jgi:hypothetical protein
VTTLMSQNLEISSDEYARGSLGNTNPYTGEY